MKFTDKMVCANSLLVLFLSACALPSAQKLNPQSPAMLGTVIAETAVAAQTRTAAALPPTLTPTLTSLPTASPIPAAQTSTPFSLFTATPELGIPLETLNPTYAVTEAVAGLGSSDNNPNNAVFTNKPWTCGVRTITPRGQEINPGAEFTAYWTVVNTGTKVWTSNTIDFVFISGYRQKEKRIQDLGSTIGPGALVTFKILFTAPKVAGEYTSIWGLQVGRTVFCSAKIFFEIP